MKIQTPSEWTKEKLIKTTTAYGNEVMIPKNYAEAWEMERLCFEEAKKKGSDLSVGVENLELSMSMTPMKKIALMVFYEKYQH